MEVGHKGSVFAQIFTDSTTQLDKNVFIKLEVASKRLANKTFHTHQQLRVITELILQALPLLESIVESLF